MKKFQLKFAILALVALIAGFFAWLIQPARLRPISKSIRRQAYLLGLRFRNPLSTRHDLAFSCFVNTGEGDYREGIITYIPDAATTSRYLLYKRGTGVNAPVSQSVTLCTAATDYPLGPSDDQADSDSYSQGIGIKLLGAFTGTTRMITDGTVLDGSFVGPSGVTPGYVGVVTTGNSCVGKAIIPLDATTTAGSVINVIPNLACKISF